MARESRPNERLSVMFVPSTRGETVSFQTTKKRLAIFAGLALFCVALVGIQALSFVGNMFFGEDQVAMITTSEHEEILDQHDASHIREIQRLQRMLSEERGEIQALHQASDELANEFTEAVNATIVQVSLLAEMTAVPLPDLELPEMTVVTQADPNVDSARGGPWNGFPTHVNLPAGLLNAERQLSSLLSIADQLSNVNRTMEGRQENLAHTPMVMPFSDSYRISDDFGSRRHPITREWDFHNGTDFAAPYGTPILAPADGVVSFAGRRAGYGRVVYLAHEDGLLFDDEGDSSVVDYQTRFAHMSRITVEEGDRVERGEQIGLVGSSGMATGAHLHYEVRVAGDPIDPMSLIRQ